MSSIPFMIIVIAASVYLLLCAYLYVAQSSMVYFPTREHAGDPAGIGLDFHDVQFTAQDSISLHGWFVRADSARGTFLFCHGNGGNISHRLELIRLYNSLGVNLFIFDYRGYGKSAGAPSEEGTYLDARAAWDYLTLEMKIPPDQIIILGRSLGGSIASNLTTEIQNSDSRIPAGLILESVITSIPDMGARLYPFLPVRMLAKFSYATIDYVSKVSCPVLMIHSPADEIAPFEFGQRVYDAANEPKSFLEIVGDHDSGYLLSGENYRNGVQTFIESAIESTLDK